MRQAACISCQTVAGEYQPPGGILYDNGCWILFLSARPPLIAGQGFIVLKRHCENVADLTRAEQESLGVMIPSNSRLTPPNFFTRRWATLCLLPPEEPFRNRVKARLK